ncbi:MAG TPA: FecR domain-containing protein [Steroidobacteraceae bacterium]|jgi:transmembrane sensor|nr:FecR domain-containing protein [Steroidobacteraceae bacterium]
MSTFSSSEERVRDLIAQQSTDWFVANRVGLNAKERAAFVSWLRASPVHVEEYLALASVARDLRHVRNASGDSVEAIVASARKAEESASQVSRPGLVDSLRQLLLRWQRAAVAVAVFGVVCVALLLAWTFRPAARVANQLASGALHFQTRHGEQHTYVLADDSVLDLNTDSAVTVRYSATERLVVLTSGEADFEVAHEPQRPFQVLAGSAEVVDVGTQFDVRLRTHSTLITVQEGLVDVAPSGTHPGSGAESGPDGVSRFVAVRTNQQISVAAGEWPVAPVAANAQRSTAWLHRQIVFEREPLTRAVAEINRYAVKPIAIATPELGNLEISGVFATDDEQGFIAFLRSLDNVHVKETATRIRVSQK